MDRIYVILIEKYVIDHETETVLFNEFFPSRESAERYVRENYREYSQFVEFRKRILETLEQRFGEDWCMNDDADPDIIEEELSKEYDTNVRCYFGGIREIRIEELTMSKDR